MNRLVCLALLAFSLAPSIASAHPHRHPNHRPSRVHLVVGVATPTVYMALGVAGPAPRAYPVPAGTLMIAPAGRYAYPAHGPQPGDYICTTERVPLDSKVQGLHSHKPPPPCGYKWEYPGGDDQFWHLVPDSNYGRR